MLFHIRHHTQYDFSHPVALESHVLRFQPRSDGAQLLRDFRLVIRPDPAGASHHLDAHGNSVTLVWFERPSATLSIVAKAELETRRSNPFDYLLTEASSRLPVHYPPEIAAPLSGAMVPEATLAADDPVKRLANDVLAQHDLVSDFLVGLCQHIYENWETVRREQGAPWPPAKTLEHQRGACRDLAWLFVCVCRAAGFAARFVSGYQEGTQEQDRRDLHAWAEVYLPGAGWRGYDPTHGLAVSDRHIAVAAAIRPQDASPVSGTFRSSAAEATINTHIEITTERQE